MDLSFSTTQLTVPASKRVGHEQELSRFCPKAEQAKRWTTVFLEESYHTTNLRMSAKEAEASDMGTGIEDRKLTN